MFNLFKIFKRKKNNSDLKLKDMVAKGFLTQEEFLRIKKDRAILEWELELKKTNKSKKR